MRLHLSLLALAIGLSAVALGQAAVAAPPQPLAARQLAVTAGAAPFHFLAFGDAPYNEEEERQLDGLIDRINLNSDAAFFIHVGDIKGGEEPCTDELLIKRKVQLLRLRLPMLYTPGDNEWTDCHRRKAGQFNPVERLQRLRQLFFHDVNAAGERRVGPYKLVTQSIDPAHRQFVENWMLRHGDVLFVGVHVVGSENNLEPWSGLDAEDTQRFPRQDRLVEFREREAAAVAWIKRAFDTAQTERAKAVVVAMQANPRFEMQPDDKRRRGFNGVLEAVRTGVRRFDGEVMLLHGDFHRYEVDHPWASDGDARIARVARVQVFGSPIVRAVRVTYDPAASPLLRAEPYAAQ